MVVVPSHYVAHIMYLCNKIHMATCFCWMQKWVVFLWMVRLWTLILIVRRNERENFQAMEMFEKCIENCNKEYRYFHHGCYNCTKGKLLSNNNTPYYSCFCCFIILMSFVLIQQNVPCQITTTIEEYLTKMVILDTSFKMLSE
jgi:hypothetical protein